MTEIPLDPNRPIEVRNEDGGPWLLRWSKDAQEWWDTPKYPEEGPSYLLADIMITRVLEAFPGSRVIYHRAMVDKLSLVVFERKFDSYGEALGFRDDLVRESQDTDSRVHGCCTAEIISANLFQREFDVEVERREAIAEEVSLLAGVLVTMMPDTVTARRTR